uniref:phage portal protein n=1 Tax=Streptococcus anginosus TaxID=1328 RepID=UPI0040265544
MGILDYILNRRKQRSSYDFDDIFKDVQQNSMKSIALETCANYIARTFSKSSFVFFGDGTKQQDAWDYRINHKANPNQTAAEFWSGFVKSLIKNGEALAYINDKQEMFVVDSYVQQHSLTGDVFNISTIQNVPVSITADYDDVLFIRVENDNLETFINDLWNDYGSVLGRLFQNQKTANQLRFHLELPRDKIRERARDLANQASDKSEDNKESASQKKESFLATITKKLENDSVVPILLPKDAKYEEYRSQTSIKVSYVEDIAKMKQQYINDVADILGIPNGLIHGDLADNQKNYDTYIATVIEPLAQKIVSAMNYIIFNRRELQKGNKVQMVGFKNYDLFSLSSNIDKLVSSGSFTRNEIRRELGYDPVEGGNVFLLTKNYMELGSIGKEKDEKT